MDTDVLRWFQDVADGATVTEVSDIERVSQSGVSRALARLEAEVGTPLFRRSGRTLRMTHAGVVFKRHVDSMMHQLDDGLAAVQQIIDPETGTVTLAYEPWLGLGVLPGIVHRFRGEHPAVHFELLAKRVETATTVRVRGDVDLELSTLRPSPTGFGWSHIARGHFELMVPLDHECASRQSLPLADTDRLPFIAHRAGSLLRIRTDELFASAGFEPRVAFECESVSAVQEYVAAGLGVALVPAGALASGPADPRVAHVSITDADTAIDVGVAWSLERRLLPAAELFLDHLSGRDHGEPTSSRA